MTASPFAFFNEVYYLRFGFWLLCAPLIAWMLFASPLIIFRRPEGRKERAIARAKKIGRWLLIMIVLYIAQGVLDRTLARHRCTVPDNGSSPDGLYEVEVCYIAGNLQDDIDGLARLRLAKDRTVLAEAEVHTPGLDFYRVDWFYWKDERSVSVGAAGDGSADFTLPPSWLDRLRARLP